MYLSLIFLSILICQTLSFQLTVGNMQMDVSDILNIPDSPVTAFCKSTCTSASDRITACGNGPSCLCAMDNVVSLQACETCMLHFLIARNTRPPDMRAGSNVIMGAYGTACQNQANVTLPATLTSLPLPTAWDGPFVGVLPVGVAVVYATFGGILGFSALYILSTM